MAKDKRTSNLVITQGRQDGWRIIIYPRRLNVCTKSDIIYHGYFNTWRAVKKQLNKLNKEGLI